MITSIAAPFSYHAPSSVEEASRLLSRYGGNARLLAGGHSLLPLMKLRLASPDALIDLGRVDGLSGIRESGDGIAVGAMTTYAEITRSDLVAERAPALAEAAAQVADTPVRNAGTIGGSIAHADPAGDLPAVVLALGAQIHARSARASRNIDVDRFFRDFMTTALRPNEVLTEIHFPGQGEGSGSAYTKLANKASHYALVGVAATVTVADGVCTAARIGITGAGPHPVRSRRAERILVGKVPSDSVIRQAARRGGVELEGQFNEDVHASAEYRAEMAKVFTARTLESAFARAAG